MLGFPASDLPQAAIDHVIQAGHTLELMY